MATGFPDYQRSVASNYYDRNPETGILIVSATAQAEGAASTTDSYEVPVGKMAMLDVSTLLVAMKVASTTTNNNDITRAQVTVNGNVIFEIRRPTAYLGGTDVVDASLPLGVPLVAGAVVTVDLALGGTAAGAGRARMQALVSYTEFDAP